MTQYFKGKLCFFFTEVSFDISEENQLSYFQNGYVFKILCKFHEPNNRLKVYIKQTDKVGKVLIACQTGKKQIMSTKQLLINFLFHPMMTFKIMFAIHFEALRLWKKGAIFKKRITKIKNNISLEK